jgi:hypothetical protein
MSARPFFVSAPTTITGISRQPNWAWSRHRRLFPAAGVFRYNRTIGIVEIRQTRIPLKQEAKEQATFEVIGPWPLLT